MFIPLCKIDEEKRLVIGRAIQEVPDKSGEIIDYETAKPAFEKWSKTFQELSGGLSKGNLRVMHDSKKVAGKVTEIDFKDDEKAIDICAKVVDDVEWKKVLEGVYTGFSVGGGYAKKWKDGDLTRYTPVVAEMSLVDNPCIPTARIAELHKRDGSVEELQLRGRPPRTFDEVMAERPRDFAEVLLAKGWSSSDHPREANGQFATKTGEQIGRYGAGLALGAAGFLAGRSAAGRRLGATAGGYVGAAAGKLAGTGKKEGAYIGAYVGREAAPMLGMSIGANAGWYGGGAYGARHDRKGREARADAMYDAKAADGTMTQEEADAAKALYRRSKGRGLERQRLREQKGRA